MRDMNLLETVIDLDAIAANTARMKELAGDAQLMCVVKAQAYNHGVGPVARVMESSGADQFGVATLAEARQLRAEGIRKPILAWIWSPEQDFRAAIAEGIDLGVPSIEHARALAGSGARVTVKVDTGLHRSGVDEAEWREVFALLRDDPTITVTGLFSHLACADEPENPYTDQQAATFRRAIEVGREMGLELPVNHLANSPASLTRPDLRFDMIRPGLALYGLDPIAGGDHGLRPAMSWVGRVTVVKPIAKGEGSSYGLTWRAPEDGFVAVIPCGYADGLPRAAQGHVRPRIRGEFFEQVGRVCMDQFVVFLGQNEAGVRPNDEAVIFGPGGMGADELAAGLDTINYEVLCRPCGRTVRRHIGGNHTGEKAQ